MSRRSFLSVLFLISLLVLVLTLSLSTPVAPGLRPYLIVWNVGQGQWSTLTTDSRCLHYDMGGERFPFAVAKLCRQKQNWVYFSHWDQDHISFALSAKRSLPNLCVAAWPGGAGTPRKKEWLSRLPSCDPPISSPILQAVSPDVREVPFNETEAQEKNKSRKTSNLASRIFSVANQVLISGDSPSRAEKVWVPHLTDEQTRSLTILVLGHHGSRTSTSEALLDHLPHLRLAIASARRHRYGHPHAETIERLRLHGIPILSTDNWGSVVLQL